jgi:hypothetical protein
MVIKSIGAMSCAKIVGTMDAIIGLLIGACISLVALIGGLSGFGGNSGLAGAVFGVAAVIFLPIFYGAMGFVVTLIATSLYNVISGWVGGVELDVQ